MHGEKQAEIMKKNHLEHPTNENDIKLNVIYFNETAVDFPCIIQLQNRCF